MNAKTQLRITKYDPQFRDEIGAYRRDEWTSITDIGRTFEGKLFSAAAYFEMENRYIETIHTLLHAYDLSEMTIRRGCRWKAMDNSTFAELPGTDDVRCLLPLEDIGDFIDQHPKSGLQIPAKTVSPEFMAGDWYLQATIWEGIPAYFFTNDRTFFLKHDFIRSLCNGRTCVWKEIEPLARLCLRGDFWCGFFGKNDSYLFLSNEYYMYFGTNADLSDWTPPEGIFVEPYPTPWDPEDFVED
ncbi:MAG: hypothetical protein Q4D98_00580 [Planctomycetia bacterium]|nr:hypothetical protein [Planctomycetia bacterium]